MGRSALVLPLLLALSALAGCFGGDEPAPGPEWTSVFDGLCADEPLTGGAIPETTWNHLPGGASAVGLPQANETAANLTGANAPVCALGSYYGIGMTTFEPTIGVTSADHLYMTSWGNGAAGSTAIVRCSGLIGMTDVSAYTCEDIYAAFAPVANSNDPYVYVDPWTDRVMKFDMHALLGMTVEWTDDEGGLWVGPTVATGAGVQDHQTIASSGAPGLLYPTTWMFCVNSNYPYPICSASQDGGATWGPELPGAPTDCNSGGLTGHLIGGPEGTFYRGNMDCAAEGYAIYRTTDNGLFWTEHRLPTEQTGTTQTWNFEDAQVAVDDAGHVHAFWIGADNLPYYANSQDMADTWSEPMMVAPPAGLTGVGFPAVAAGGDGTAAMVYIGHVDDVGWNGYLTLVTDAWAETPLLTTVQINGPVDPLDANAGCGYERCGGFGDFHDVIVDQHGRAWFGTAHNEGGQLGIFGSVVVGPGLRGKALAPLVVGGPSTL